MSGGRTKNDTKRREAAESLHPLVPAPEPGEADWIPRLRSEALSAFEAQGIPTRRLEAWKGTSLAALEAITFERVGPRAGVATIEAVDALAASAPEDALAADGPELVFVDGRFVPERSRLGSLGRGVRLASLAELRRSAPEQLAGRLGSLATPKLHALVALQTAFLDDGAVLLLERDTVVDEPIALRWISTGDAATGASAAFPRLLVVAGERSRAALFQTHASVGTAPGLTALVGELHLAAGARIETIQVQAESTDRIHFTQLAARLDRDARLDSHVFTTADGLTRSELEVTLAEPGAETRLRGLFLGRGSGHVDHYTTVDHAAPHSTSDEEYRGVLADRSEGVFRGRVIIRPDAQKSDARQSNPNLLLSERARIDAKPQLEIYADDVRASHGSTIGQLDPDALFFLRSRGIAAPDARIMMTRAFARTIVQGLASEAIRANVAARVDAALSELERGDGAAPPGTGPEGRKEGR